MNSSDYSRIIPPIRGDSLLDRMGYPTLRTITFFELTGQQVNTNIDDIRTALEALALQIYPSIQRLNAIDHEFSKKLEDITNYIASHEGLLNSINHDITHVYKIIKDDENVLAQHYTSIQSIYADIVSIFKESEDLKNLLHSLLGFVNSINSELLSLGGRVKIIEIFIITVNDLENFVHSINGRLSSIETRIAPLIDTLDNILLDIDSINSDILDGQNMQAHNLNLISALQAV